MDINEIIEKRRSVRSYRDDPVIDEYLDKILEAARMAPSAHNSQEHKFVVVQEKGIIKKLSKAANQRFMAEAPIVIVGVSLNPEHVLSNEVPAYAMNIAVALDHISLVAAELGLGTCWIGAFSQKDVKDVLNIPEKYKVAALMTLGVPYDDPGVKSRKKLKELVCYDNFSE